MHLAFLDFSGWDYTVQAAYDRPLGGSQSALCYLTEELARAAHRVALFTGTPHAVLSRGVVCAPLTGLSAEQLAQQHAVIVQNYAKRGPHLKSALPPGVPLILWTQHAHDQPAVRALEQPAVRDSYDGFAFVSDWQLQRYVEAFGLPRKRCRVLRNAAAPVFHQQFRPDEMIAPAKDFPPILAYTSTPFRGLDWLLAAFPRLRAAVPDLRLRVFSSMRVYQVADEQDAAQYGHLYDLCRRLPGVEYVGSLPQPELARQLRRATLLAYPNHFAETSCIAVLEALAAGCRVVTSDLGALRETLGGWGRLVPFAERSAEYLPAFIDACLDELRRARSGDDAHEQQLRQQVSAQRDSAAWSVRATEWEAWLRELAGRPALAPALPAAILNTASPQPR